MSDKDIQARLAEVTRAYLASLTDKRRSIADLWRGLDQQWSEEAFAALHLNVHSLAGSAETFGLADVTRAARAVVDELRQLDTQPPSTAMQTRIDYKLRTLLALLEQHQPE